MLGVHRVTSSGGDYYLSDLAEELPLLAEARSYRGCGSGRRPSGWVCTERSIRGDCGRCSTVDTRRPDSVCGPTAPPFSASI